MGTMLKQVAMSFYLENYHFFPDGNEQQSSSRKVVLFPRVP